jgi:hypothetical protein
LGKASFNTSFKRNVRLSEYSGAISIVGSKKAAVCIP